MAAIPVIADGVDRIWVVTQPGPHASSRGLYRHWAIGYRADSSLLVACGTDPIYGEHFEMVVPGWGKLCPECAEIIAGENAVPRMGGIVRLPAWRTKVVQPFRATIEVQDTADFDYAGFLNGLEDATIRGEHITLLREQSQAVSEAYEARACVPIELYQRGVWAIVYGYIVMMSLDAFYGRVTTTLEFRRTRAPS